MAHQVHPIQRLIVVGICLAVSGLHFVTGPSYSGPFPIFVNGYLIDILLPFAMCLLLGIQKVKALRGRALRFVLVFGVGLVAETLQFLGVPLFGSTFDPLDYVMYVAGTTGAFVFERVILSRIPRRTTVGTAAGTDPRTPHDPA